MAETSSLTIRDRLLIGQTVQCQFDRLGFSSRPAGQTSQIPRTVEYAGDSHLVTIAPTRSGKGRGLIIPNLLSLKRPVIVIDPKGENYQVTARFRRSLGHQVVKLDPFGVVNDGRPSDALNPFDLFNLPGVDVESEAQMLARLLSEGNRGVKDPFWDENGSGLLSGQLAAIRTTRPSAEQTMESVFNLLMGSDVVYGLAVLLDTVGEKVPKMAYREIAAFLQLSERDTRPGVLATAQSYVKPLLSRLVLSTLKESTFSLSDIMSGQPVDVFLILPPDKLRSHAGLLKLWIGTLLKTITSRRQQPISRTLMIIDEAAQLGQFTLLETVLTVCAGYGLQCWTFWQNLAQLKCCYGEGYRTVLDNCDVLQTFGLRNGCQVAELAQLFAVPESRLWDMQPDEQLVSIAGAGTGQVCQRFDYLNDPQFQGRFDDNRLHATGRQHLTSGSDVQRSGTQNRSL